MTGHARHGAPSRRPDQWTRRRARSAPRPSVPDGAARRPGRGWPRGARAALQRLRLRPCGRRHAAATPEPSAPPGSAEHETRRPRLNSPRLARPPRPATPPKLIHAIRSVRSARPPEGPETPPSRAPRRPAAIPAPSTHRLSRSAPRIGFVAGPRRFHGRRAGRTNGPRRRANGPRRATRGGRPRGGTPEPCPRLIHAGPRDRLSTPPCAGA